VSAANPNVASAKRFAVLGFAALTPTYAGGDQATAGSVPTPASIAALCIRQRGSMRAK